MYENFDKKDTISRNTNSNVFPNFSDDSDLDRSSDKSNDYFYSKSTDEKSNENIKYKSNVADSLQSKTKIDESKNSDKLTGEKDTLSDVLIIKRKRLQDFKRLFSAFRRAYVHLGLSSHNTSLFNSFSNNHSDLNNLKKGNDFEFQEKNSDLNNMNNGLYTTGKTNIISNVNSNLSNDTDLFKLGNSVNADKSDLPSLNKNKQDNNQFLEYENKILQENNIELENIKLEEENLHLKDELEKIDSNLSMPPNYKKLYESINNKKTKLDKIKSSSSKISYPTKEKNKRLLKKSSKTSHDKNNRNILLNKLELINELEIKINSLSQSLNERILLTYNKNNNNKKQKELNEKLMNLKKRIDNLKKELKIKKEKLISLI